MSEQTLSAMDRVLSSVAVLGSFALLMAVMTYGWFTAFRVMAG